MRAMRAHVNFEEPFPAEQREPLRQIIERNEWILPGWLETIIVDFEQPDKKTISLRVTVMEEYRRMRVSVCPEWLTSNQQTRESDVRHEFLHITTDPLYQVARQLLNLIDDNNAQLVQWAAEQLRIGVERTTCDLESALNRKFDT